MRNLVILSLFILGLSGESMKEYLDREGIDYQWFIKSAEIGCENLDKQYKKEDQTHACSLLADAYEQGEVVPYDAQKAFFYAKKACDLNNGNACANVSYCYYNGLGVNENPKEALRYAKKGCDLGVGFSCSKLGFYYYEGEIVPYDMEKAKEYAKKACELGDTDSCKIYKTLMTQ